MHRFVVSVVFCVLVVYTRASPFQDCGSTTGTISSVQITDCADSQDECSLKRGTQAGITINFSSKADSKALTAVVHGVISSVPMPFPLPEPDACKTGVTCPVKNGQSYTYSNSLNVREAYPPLAVTVRFELKDEKGNDMVCVDIPCRIQ